MKKITNLFHNKTFLKFLLAILIIALGIAIYSLQSTKVEIPIHKKKLDNTAEIKKLTDVADEYFDNNQKDSAIIVFNKVRKLCNPETNTIDYVYALSCIAEIQYKQSDYIASDATATEALPYLKNIKNPRYSWIVYNILGLNYLNSFDEKNAILYFKKAIKLKTSNWRKRIAINNLVVVYTNQKKYNESLTLLKILASKKDISKDKYIDNSDYSYLLDNLGYCYFKMGDSTKALKHFYEGLKIRLNPETSEGLSDSYRNLSRYFLKNNNQLLAKAYAMQAFKTDIRTNSVLNQVSSLNLIIKSSEGNDLKKYTLKYIHIVDSINLIRKKTKNPFATIKYNYNKDREENLQLKALKIENELQLERQENRKIISYLIILFILGFLLFFSFYLSVRGKKEKKDAIYTSETRISRKLHNELAKDLYYTLNFSKIRDLSLDENKEHLLNNLEAIYTKTRIISKENSIIITDENYFNALKEMISGFKTPNLNLILNGFDSIFWNDFEKNQKIILYRVIQELLFNMKKHSNATLAGFTFKETDKHIVINYTDNGKGANLNKIIFRNGLHNIETRIMSLKGEIKIESAPDKGFKVFFKLPL